MEYRIYPLKDQSRLEELCTLFAKGLADTTPEYWKWKHFSENGHPEGMILVAEAEDGTLAGMFALQPERYEWNGREILMVQTEDLVIDPNHRGTGLMRRLYSHAMKHYAAEGAVGFVSFCNENSYPIFLKYGSVDRGYIYTLNSKKTNLPIYTNRKKAKAGNWMIELSGDRPEDLFYPVHSDGYGMVKNDTFMKWKFTDNPEGPFQWVTIRENGRLKGYVTICVIQGRFRRAVNIYDWALKEDVSTFVLKKTVDLLRTHGNWVSLWGKYDDAVLNRWMQAGMTVRSEKGTHFVLHQLGAEPLPDCWHLTRADLDY